MAYLIVALGYILMEFQVLEVKQIRTEEPFIFKFLISTQSIRFHYGIFKHSIQERMNNSFFEGVAAERLPIRQ